MTLTLGPTLEIERLIASIDWAVDHLGWTEVIHCIEAPNTASIAVAERLGSTRLRQAQLPAPFEAITVEVWGQSREACRARWASLRDDAR